MAAPWNVTVDCVDAKASAAFWRLALGYVESPPPPGFASREDWFRRLEVPEQEWGDAAYIEDPAGLAPAISFLKVPEPKVAKNRLHIDVMVSGGRRVEWETRWPLVTRKVGELVAAGATVLREQVLEGKPDHVVMIDPEGNEFCVG